MLQEITKELAIIAFKNACAIPDISTYIKRNASVKRQFQRNIWEIYNKYFGLIRISKEFGNPCSILAYPSIKNDYYTNRNDIQMYLFNLSIEEYNELKDLYFGIFKEDDEYFKYLNELYK